MFEPIDHKMDLLRRSPSDRRDVLVAMKQRLDAELTFHEMAVSGTPLARMDVRRMIEAKGHMVLRARILREAYNFHRATRYVERFARHTPDEIGEGEIFDAHALLLRDIDQRRAGQWRLDAPEVREPGQAVSALAIPTAMLEVFRWLGQTRGAHAISQATELHLRLMYIQPFSEMNGRIARLWMNLLLQQRGLPPALLSAEDRPVYGEAVARAGIDGGRALERLIASGVERAVDLCLDVCERAPQVAVSASPKTAAS